MSDIALKAGVSRTAVSHVLSERQQENVRVSDTTRQRILDVANELGYRPNQVARAVASGKTHTIGYLVSEPRYEPYWNIIVGSLTAAEELGFTLKVLPVSSRGVSESDLTARIRRITELRLSGWIVRVNGDKSLIFDEANSVRIPVVTVDEGVPQPFGARVTSDDTLGVRSAIEHLTHLGHRRIGFISSGFPQLHKHYSAGDVGTAREELFCHEMAARSLEVPAGYVTYDTYDAVQAYDPVAQTTVDCSSSLAATNALLTHPKGRPTAIFCWRDETAMFAVRECRRQGLRVPEDISVVGFSDIGAARLFDPPLSTVQMPWEGIGRMAIQQLTRRIGEEFDPSPTTHLVAPKFVVRGSSGPART
jgi:LacI family transcriptional regulator